MLNEILAKALKDNKLVIAKRCLYCGNLFELTRKDRIYCSSSCKRMAHYYVKKDS